MDFMGRGSLVWWQLKTHAGLHSRGLGVWPRGLLSDTGGEGGATLAFLGFWPTQCVHCWSPDTGETCVWELRVGHFCFGSLLTGAASAPMASPLPLLPAAFIIPVSPPDCEDLKGGVGGCKGEVCHKG